MADHSAVVVLSTAEFYSLTMKIRARCNEDFVKNMQTDGRKQEHIPNVVVHRRVRS
jgi:hypothetical protein